MRVFDSHAHYWDRKLIDKTEELLAELFVTTLDGVVNVGTSPETCRLAVAQAEKFAEMYTALGIHPSDAAELSGAPEENVAEIRRLLLDPASKAVAIGEIGLDYYWEPYDPDLQKKYFRLQMALAEELGMPVVIHDREAHGDCFDIICEFPHVTGVFHSYSGSGEMARDLIRRGWYISFSGTVSFKNANRVREAARNLDRSRVLIETDAPYLTPHPHRGELNHSGYLPLTCTALAQTWGISPEESARITRENARRFFGLRE